MIIEDFRALPGHAQEDLRCKAVRAVNSGRTQNEVAALFGVSRQAVSFWIRLWHSGGIAALKAQQRGRPCGGTLKAWQAARIVKAITDRCPDQLKLPFYLWTREAVAQLIERRFGYQLSIWTVGRYLSQWGFTPQKPVRRAFEQNPEKVRRWLKEEYPLIVRLAKREKAEILWGDETGMRSDHAVGRSFSRKGHTPVIPGTGQRFGCNMISAITNRGRLVFMVFKKRFDAPVLIIFLARLIRQTERRAFVILDSHPVHRSGRVRNWIKSKKAHMRVFYLPGYSPELNPDEMLNQDVKSNAVGRQRAHTQVELVTKVRSYLRSTQRQPHIVKNYFQEEHVRYAAM